MQHQRVSSIKKQQTSGKPISPTEKNLSQNKMEKKIQNRKWSPQNVFPKPLKIFRNLKFY